MRFRLTVILILLNVALAAAVLYLGKTSAASDRSAIDQRLILPAGIVEDADYLSLDGPGMADVWELHRMGAEEWYLRTPVSWPANVFAVNRVFRALRFLEWETRFTVRDLERAGQRLQDYGLDEPRATLKVGAGSQRVEVRIGQATEFGNRLYIRSPDGRHVYVVSRELLAGLSMDLEMLRSERVLRIPVFEVRGLQVQSGGAGGAKARLRRSAGSWSIEAPLQARADSLVVEAALKRAYAMEVLEFPSVDAALHGLDNPRLRITFEGNNRRQTLLVGNAVSGAPAPAIYARLEDNPTVFTVAAEAIEPFQNAHLSMRDRRLFHFDPEALTLVEVAGSSHSITLQRLETGAWQVLRGHRGDRLQTWPADSDVIAGIINKLSRLDVIRFGSDDPDPTELANAGLDDPQRRITLRGTGDHTLVVGDLDPGQNLLWVRAGESASTYQIDPDILHALPMNPLSYRSRTLDALPRAAIIRSITLTDLESGETVLSETIDPVETAWDRHWADRPDEAREALFALRNAIRRFRVDRFVREGFEDPLLLDSATEIPWRFQLDARITLPGSGGSEEEKRVRYFFSERVGGLTQFGGIPEQNLVFTLTQPVMDALDVLSEPRAVPAPPTPPAEADEGTAPEPAASGREDDKRDEDIPVFETVEDAAGGET